MQFLSCSILVERCMSFKHEHSDERTLGVQTYLECHHSQVQTFGNEPHERSQAFSDPPFHVMKASLNHGFFLVHQWDHPPDVIASLDQRWTILPTCHCNCASNQILLLSMMAESLRSCLIRLRVAPSINHRSEWYSSDNLATDDSQIPPPSVSRCFHDSMLRLRRSSKQEASVCLSSARVLMSLLLINANVPITRMMRSSG